MGIAQSELERILKEAFSDGTVVVTDLAGDENHYRASITSPQFTGKNRVQQHKLVWEKIKAATDVDIHALSMETRTP